MLSFDTETSPIAPANLAPELACISFSDGQNADLVHWSDSYRTARWLLEQPALTTANGAFDFAVLWAMHPDLRDLIWDGIVQRAFLRCPHPPEADGHRCGHLPSRLSEVAGGGEGDTTTLQPQ